jgi:steroid 5-alpha reductase family enzyme
MSLLLAALGLCVVMTGAWALTLRLGNASWVDAIWTFGLGAAGILVAEGDAWVTGLMALWSLRLGLHIAARSRGAPEDARYAALRRDWGAAFPARLFGFLQIQALAAAVLLMPVVLAAGASGALRLPGAALALTGLAIEAIADAQLRAFRRTATHAEVCDRGLWSVSRHPNYLGEFLFWCGLAVIALDAPWGVAALLGPALMYWLLVHVSGIPPLEAHMATSRGAAWADYAARVPAFFPTLAGAKR